jgi:hypothetical protein
MKKQTETLSNLEVLDRLLNASINEDHLLNEDEEVALSAVLEDYRELKRGLTIALNYIAEDIAHYEDVADTEATQECKAVYEKLKAIQDFVN